VITANPSSLLVDFLNQHVIGEKTPEGFFHSHEIEWILGALGTQADFGWDENGLSAARQAIEPLSKRPSRLDHLRLATDQALGGIASLSTFECSFTLDFLRGIDRELNVGKEAMVADGVNPRRASVLAGGRRHYLYAVIAILVRYRCEPLRRNFRPVEEASGGEDSGVITFPGGESLIGADQDEEDEDPDDDDTVDDEIQSNDQPGLLSCQIIEFHSSSSNDADLEDESDDVGSRSAFQLLEFCRA